MLREALCVRRVENDDLFFDHGTAVRVDDLARDYAARRQAEIDMLDRLSLVNDQRTWISLRDERRCKRRDDVVTRRHVNDSVLTADVCSSFVIAATVLW